MSLANIYGRILSPKQVERGVAASIELWIDDYLGELERIDGYQPDAIQRPLGVITSSDLDKWPEDQIPVIVVMNGGLAGPPVRRADGTYDCSWLISVAPIVSDTDFASTRDLSGTYIAAIRACVLQHKLLASPLYPDGFADHSIWQGEQPANLRFEQTRTIAAWVCAFEIGVNSVITEQAGPRVPYEPASDDPGPYPVVDPAPVINVTPIGVGEPL